MKLYIVGSVGSGKSTLARHIAMHTGVPCTHLDEVMYEEDPTDSWGNKKRPLQEQKELFGAVLASPDYIVEDAGRVCFLKAMEQADTVILLEPPLWVRKKRILVRWIKQKLGVEPCIYKPHLKILKAMYKWLKNYETGADGTKGRVVQFREKLLILHTNREIEEYIRRLPQ